MGDDWLHPLLLQLFVDLPHQLPPLFLVRFDRLPLEALLHFAIAVSGVVPLGAADVVLIKLLVGIVDRADRKDKGDLVILARQPRKPKRRLDQLQLGVDVSFLIGLNLTGGGVDDPDQQFYESYGCGSPRNYTGCCNAELDKMLDGQSAMSDVEKRKHMVWAIEQKLADDDARPILFYTQLATCHYAKRKVFVTQVNSIYNGQRFEDLRLDN